MSIFSPHEVLDCYDTLTQVNEEGKQKVEHLLNYDDGIMHRKTINRLEAIALQSQADLPADPEKFLKVVGNL